MAAETHAINLPQDEGRVEPALLGFVPIRDRRDVKIADPVHVLAKESNDVSSHCLHMIDVEEYPRIGQVHCLLRRKAVLTTVQQAVGVVQKV
jgi:hypothetical protein